MGLFYQRFGNGRMGMTEAAHGDAAAQVEITFAADIENIAALSMAQDQFKTAVTGHDIF